jgi:HTH-type transcriptional regulator/antitoxin HigA
LKERGWTQKDFARLLGKKVSEVNELIKGKRNITVHRDILLSVLFDDPEQKWCRLQLEYDYYLGKQNIDPRKLHEIKATKDSE